MAPIVCISGSLPLLEFSATLCSVSYVHTKKQKIHSIVQSFVSTDLSERRACYKYRLVPEYKCIQRRSMFLASRKV